MPYVEEALRWLPDDGRVARFERDAERSAGRDRHAPAASARVLIADDNADMRDYLASHPRSELRVEAVGDGRAALERIAADPPDLVLTDVMMPTLDGFGLLTAIRADERMRAVPVDPAVGRAGEEARIEGLQAGADDYLVKPFSARELLASRRVTAAAGAGCVDECGGGAHASAARERRGHDDAQRRRRHRRVRSRSRRRSCRR